MTSLFFIFCQIIAQNEEKTCHENLWMSHPLSTYRSVSGPGEFGLCILFIKETSLLQVDHQTIYK